MLVILNDHFRVVTEAIKRHQCTLVQYVGDMVMGAFNVPDDQPDHPQRAARATLDLRDSQERFAAERETSGLPALRVGIGLSTGPVIAGYQGTEHRYEYSTLGDTANVTFHVCGQAKPGQILISQALQERLGDWAKVETLGSVRFKRRRRGPCSSC